MHFYAEIILRVCLSRWQKHCSEVAGSMMMLSNEVSKKRLGCVAKILAYLCLSILSDYKLISSYRI